MHHVAVDLDRHELSTSTLPASQTRPRSLRPRSTSITCSARSFSSASSSRAMRPSSSTSHRADACRRSAASDTRAPGCTRQQRLRAGARDLEVAEVQEVHVGTRVHRAQAAVDRERLHRHRRRPALRGHHLEGVARVDVAHDALHHRFELLARHVRLELRHLCAAECSAVGSSARGTGAGELLANLRNRRRRGARTRARRRARPPDRRWRGS